MKKGHEWRVFLERRPKMVSGWLRLNFLQMWCNGRKDILNGRSRNKKRLWIEIEIKQNHACNMQQNKSKNKILLHLLQMKWKWHQTCFQNIYILYLCNCVRMTWTHKSIQVEGIVGSSQLSICAHKLDSEGLMQLSKQQDKELSVSSNED